MVDEAAAAKARHHEIMRVLPGLMLAMALAMLDNMIVATAMPRIVGELGGLAHLSWVVTSYVLGTTVSTPLWGKLGDLYGRKRVFLVSIVIFLAGSTLCGMAGSAVLSGAGSGMIQLIVFRALQGLGAGGLLVNAFATIGDLMPPLERGRYQGIMSGTMGLTMIAGPLVGGFITDYLSWRWAFFVNLPLGAVALALLAANLRLPVHRTEHRIDWAGAGTLAVGISALVLITTWGGSEYPWASTPILLLACIAAVSLAIFLWIERNAAEPILPLHLFRDSNFTLSTVISFLLGFAMFGSMNFVPLFQQMVQGDSATRSGLSMLPMMLGMMVVSIVVGQLITRTGRYRQFPIIGGVLIALAMWMLSLQHSDATRLQTGIAIAVLGAGMGFLMQTTMLISQNSVPQKDMGVGSSASTFFRSIGGSFGVSLFGAVFSHRLVAELSASMGPETAHRMVSTSGSISPTVFHTMPPQLRTQLVEALATSIDSVFAWAVLFAALLPLIAWFIKHVPLRGGGPASEHGNEVRGTATFD